MAPTVPLKKCPRECGMVIIILGGEEEKIVPIPLKEVSVKARLVDFVAEVTLEQTYKNEEKGPVEAVYMFPLDEEASVVQFQADLDGRTVKGEVKEKEEAKKQYEEAMEKRQTAFLASENKPDIFQVKVGNLSPGAQAKVRLVYLTETSVEGKALRFFLPTTIAPRYTPELSRTNSAVRRISRIAYSLSSSAPIKISVECEMKSKIISIESPTHSVTTDIGNTLLHGGSFYCGKATLTGQATDMDRDFILMVTTENPHQPRVCVEKWGESVASLVSLVPSFNLDEQPVELIFLLDRSGSMTGQSLDQAKKALTLFLQSLPIDSYFNIVGFGNEHEFLFQKSAKYDDDSLKTAISHAANLEADMGGTDIYTPLSHIFREEPIEGYLRQMFLLTDGQVSNTYEIIRLVKQNSHNTRVFTLGIGDSASHHLVGGIARAGGGTAEYATYKEALEAKVQGQLKNALFPALSEVSVAWEGVSTALKPHSTITTEKTLLGYRKPTGQTQTTEEALRGPQGAPHHIPPVFDGSRLLVYCIWEDGSVPTGVTITAKSPDGPLTTTVKVTQEDLLTGDLLHKLAARKLIRDLEEGTSLLHSVISEPPEERLKEEIVKLGIKYGLVSSHTSFVAVDPRRHGMDKDLYAIQTRHVASQIPHGWHGIQPRMMMYSASPADAILATVALSAPVTRAMPIPVSLESDMTRRMTMARPNRLTLTSGPVDQTQQCRATCANNKRVLMPPVSFQPDETIAPTTGGILEKQASRSSFMPQLESFAELEENTSETLHEIMAFIKFDGGFLADPGFAKAIGIDWQEVNDAGGRTGADLSCWVTALAIKFMEMTMQSSKAIWELAAAKSKKWLSKSTPDSVSLLQKAEEFLKAKGVTEEKPD